MSLQLQSTLNAAKSCSCSNHCVSESPNLPIKNVTRINHWIQVTHLLQGHQICMGCCQIPLTPHPPVPHRYNHKSAILIQHQIQILKCHPSTCDFSQKGFPGHQAHLWIQRLKWHIWKWPSSLSHLFVIKFLPKLKALIGACFDVIAH